MRKAGQSAGRVLLMAAVVCVWSAQARAQQGDEANTFELRGKVVNAATGAGVGNALVQSIGTGQMQFSGADGTFVFAGVPVGAYSFTVAKPGYFNGAQLGHPGVDGVERVPSDEELVLKMTPEGIIYGTVENESGQPLEGMEVRAEAWRVINGAKSLQTAGQGTTNDEGQFRIAELQPGTYYVKFLPKARGGTRVYSEIAKKRRDEEGMAPQFYPGVTDVGSATAVRIKGGAQVQIAQALKRQRLFEVTGAVRGGDLERGFQVMLMDPSGEALQKDVHTDPKSGEFQIQGVPEGKYELVATAADTGGVGPEGGRPPLAAMVPIELNRDINGLVLMLGRGASVDVHIEDEIPGEGQEIHQVQLTMTSKGFLQTSQGLIVPPAAGAVRGPTRFEGLAPGSYEVEAWSANVPKGYVASLHCGDVDLLRDDLTIAAGAAVPPIEVKLKNDGAELNIEIKSSDKTSVNTVVLYSMDYPKRSTVLGVQGEGKATVGNLRPGTYKVVALQGGQEVEFRDASFIEKYVAPAPEVSLRASDKASVQVEAQQLGEESSQ